MDKRVRGLFLTGTDTDVGKTYVGALIARQLRRAGHRVGVYKPAASGCRRTPDGLVSDDASALWEAAGRPGTLKEVCPQRFAAPLAPHLAARAEGQRLDRSLLREGISVWFDRSDVVLVEGAGGLLSPLGKDESVADLAVDFGFPLVIVARNGLGVINHVLQTLFVAANYRGGMPIAGIVLNRPTPPSQADVSLSTNREEIAARAAAPVLAEVAWQGEGFDSHVDWFSLARWKTGS
jgi:dethiobiotin synthetase